MQLSFILCCHWDDPSPLTSSWKWAGMLAWLGWFAGICLPKYATLLMGEGGSWQLNTHYYILKVPCCCCSSADLSTVISDMFFTLTMAKTGSETENPEISLSSSYREKPFLEKRVFEQATLALQLQSFCPAKHLECLASHKPNPGMPMKSLPRQRSHWHQLHLSQRSHFTAMWEMYKYLYTTQIQPPLGWEGKEEWQWWSHTAE